MFSNRIPILIVEEGMTTVTMATAVVRVMGVVTSAARAAMQPLIGSLEGAVITGPLAALTLLILCKIVATCLIS